MTNRKKTAASKAKRGFAVLDREKGLKLAMGAVTLLRSLSDFATSSQSWRSGLGYGLEQVEGELNDILRFSGGGRLPDDPFDSAKPVPADLSMARKSAAGSVKALRKILKDARADLSVEEGQCIRLDQALDLIEEKLNDLLPPPGAPPKAKLPGLFAED